MAKSSCWPEKTLNKYELLEKLIAFEKMSHFDEFEKNFFDEGPHLTSSSALPWGDSVRQLVSEAKKRFEWGQTWHSGKGARIMEREVISMIGELFHNPEAVGFICYGGSEADICALAAAKGRAFFKRFPGFDRSDPYVMRKLMPEFEKESHSIVMPIHSHYSLFKGCALLGLEPISVSPKTSTIYDIDPAEVKGAVRDDTIGIIGTAGTWPFGSIDPIEEMGKVAEEYDLYFHVDACFGGLILPFLERSGYYTDLPAWDFRIPGVMSISADFHKNGMVPPPASSLCFRNREIIEYARMIAPPFGTLSGTRSTSPMAAAWTMLHALGIEGYKAVAQHSMHLREKLIEATLKIPSLKVVEGGKINLTVLYSETLDLRPVSKALIEKGWMHATGKNPSPIALCICTMPQNDGQIESFAKDFAEAIKTKAVLIGKLEDVSGFDLYGRNIDLDI